MTDQFLPSDYSEPSNSDEVKLKEGSTKLRLLQSPVFMASLWEDTDELKDDWKPKRKVTRVRLASEKDVPRGYKFAWLCLAYNYDDAKIQYWEVSQWSIRDSIVSLSQDPDIGSPLHYDIKVIRKGSWMKTEYSVQKLDKSEMPEKVIRDLETLNVNFDHYIETWESPFNIAWTNTEDERF